MAWRESRLANLRYKLTETIQDVEAKTGIVKKTWSEKAYEVRRLGEAYWISGTVDFGGSDGPRRFWSGWDGVVYRTFCEAGKIRTAAGSVAPEEHPLLSQIRFNALLGLRLPGIDRVEHGVSKPLPFTLTEWMDHFIARKDKSLVV